MQQKDNTARGEAPFIPIPPHVELGKPIKKIYISGQISGQPIDSAREKFERAERRIKAMGSEPVTPMKNGLPENAPWELHMAHDIEL